MADYAHKTALEIPIGTDRRQMTKKGKDFLITMEKSNLKNEEMREIAKFSLLIAMLEKKGSFTRRQLQESQHIIMDLYQKHDCSIDDSVLNLMIDQIRLSLGLPPLEENV